MPTLQQLQAEPYWGREIVTDELRWLGAELCRRTGRPADAYGTKGNAAHLRGAHRSQEWILRSTYCTNRTYTVQAGLVGDQLRYVAGVDWTPGDVEVMIAQSQRLMAAVKSGALEEVRELYCNVDGDQVVDGWDNVRDRAASSDSSHLWHWHLTLDRRRLRDSALMARIVDIALGGDMAGEADAAFVKPYTGSEPWVSGQSWMAKAVETPLRTLVELTRAIATRVDIDATELAAIETAARAGAAAAADDVVARILAGLPESALTRADVEAAVRSVLGGLDGATPQA